MSPEEIKQFRIELVSSWIAQGMERQAAFDLFMEMYNFPIEEEQ